MTERIPDIRPLELLALWSDLDDAYHGDNKFGGDIAELYAYRFDVYSPYLHGGVRPAAPPPMFAEKVALADLDRRQRLYDLLVLFASQRECKIRVNGRPHGRWVLKEPFDHRVHVQVERVDA